MRFLIFILFIFIAFPAEASEQEKHTIAHDGMERDYWLYDPRGDGAKAGLRPLLIVLHGGGGKADKFGAMTTKESSVNALADREDILVAYPQGYSKNWNDGRAVEYIEAHQKGLDDTGFISALIDTLVESRKVDPKRVYAVGPSNGGHMANRLACDIPGKVAAVGIVIGLMPVNYVPQCKPAAPVSVLIMNGTEDPIVPYDGGFVKLFKGGRARGEDISTDDTFAFWLKHAGFGGKPADIKPEQLPDTDPKDETRVSVQSYKGAQSEVVLYRVEGGGHTWPGGNQYLFQKLVGRVSHDINATQVIWDFFKDKKSP